MFFPSKVAEIEITYKTHFKKSELFQVTCSFDAFNILRSNWANDIEHKERMYIILLNRNNKVLGINNLFVGGLASCPCDIKVVMQTCLISNASAFMLSHNHPSGNLQPSKGDIEMTQKLKAAAATLDIIMLDHIIITDENYYSFADSGRL